MCVTGTTKPGCPSVTTLSTLDRNAHAFPELTLKGKERECVPKQRPEEQEEGEEYLPFPDEILFLLQKYVRKQVHISVRVLGDVFRKAL